MSKRRYFLKIFRKAELKYGNYEKRLAGEGWKYDWQTLIATIYSAQSRDELTISVMEKVFLELDSLEKYAKAPVSEIMKLTKKMNYYKTKSKNSKACAQMLLNDFKGVVPDTIEELVRLPGVGRKTANLVITEVYGKEGICVDTHVHRISNVLGFVKTKNPEETEFALKKIVPNEYWSRINRLFVLWGKEISGRDKKKLLSVFE
jgi:endonuclease III